MSVASPVGIAQAEQEIDNKDNSLKPSTETESAQKEMDIKPIDSSTSKRRSASPDEPSKKNKKNRRRSRSMSRSRTRSRSRSKSRSRSRSRNHSSRSRSRSRSRGREHHTRSRSRTYSPVKTSSSSRRVVNGRIHVSDFDSSISRHDLEKAFEKYGKIVDIWLASYPPFYAFITFKRDEDAEQAIRKMNDAYVRSHRVRVAHALPKRESFHAVRHGGRYSGGWSGYGGCRRRRSFTKSPIRDSRRSRRSRTRERSHSRSRSRSSSHSSHSTRSRSR